MRDKRAIIIKNPRLQKIRNNLRNVIIQAFLEQWKHLEDRIDKISRYDDGKAKLLEDMTKEEIKKFRVLQEKQNMLDDLTNRSILTCVSCGKGERDMVYNKPFDAWYCTECYNLHRNYTKKRTQEKKGAKPRGHEEKAIDELYKSFN